MFGYEDAILNVILFGATGMVGQGVLRECLLDPDVRVVLSVGRSATGQVHPKLREIVHKDLLDSLPSSPRSAASTRVSSVSAWRAMLRVAKQGAPKPILETRDINAL